MKQLADIEEAVKTGHADVDDLFTLGDAYLAEGRHSDLLGLCDMMTRMPMSDLDRATAFSYKGVTHVCLCDWDNATEAFVQALELLENEPENQEEVVSLKGLNYYDLSLYCPDPDRARIYGDLAMEHLTTLARDFPEYPHMSKVFAHLADLHHTRGELDDAMVYYGMFYEASPAPEDQVWGLSGMASVFVSLDKPDKALSMYHQALQVSDSDALLSKIYFDMGEMQYQFEEVDKARASLKTALEFREQDPVLGQNKEYEISILWRLGTIAYDQEEDEEMLDLFGRTLAAIDSGHAYFADIHLRLGHYHSGQCRYDAASRHYHHVLLTPAASVEETVAAREGLEGLPTARKSLPH